MGSPSDRIRDFSDPEVEILRAHFESYLDRYAEVWVLGDRTDTLGSAGRVNRQLLDQEQFDAVSSYHPCSLRNSAPVPHAESKIFDKLLVKGTRLLITGNGGLGKSETLRHFASCAAEVGTQSTQSWDVPTLRVPVFFELREFDVVGSDKTGQQYGTFLDAMLRNLPTFDRHGETGKQLFRELADTGRLMVLLDGLDEADEGVKQALEILLPVACESGNLRHCSLALASRPSALSLRISNLFPRKTDRFTPELLTLTDMETYVHSAMNDNAAGAMVNAIHSAVPSIMELLRWPLMLALACKTKWPEPIELPKSPSSLMDKAINTLLSQRKIEHISGSIEVLSDLARLALVGNGRLGHAEAVQEVQRLKSVAGPSHDAFHAKSGDRVLRDLAVLSGFFFGDSVYGYRFSVRPLAEYLAGRRLATLPEAELMELFSRHSWQVDWERPLYWMAGDLWRGSSEQRQIVEQMVGWLLEHCKRHLDDSTGTCLRLAEWLMVLAGDGQLSNPIVSAYLELAERNRGHFQNHWGAPISELPNEVRSGLCKLLAGEIIQHCGEAVRIPAAPPDRVLGAPRINDEREAKRFMEESVAHALIDCVTHLGVCDSSDLINELRKLFSKSDHYFVMSHQPTIRFALYRAITSLGEKFEPGEEVAFLSDPDIMATAEEEEAIKAKMKQMPPPRRRPLWAKPAKKIPDIISYRHPDDGPRLEVRRDEAMFCGSPKVLTEKLSALGITKIQVKKWGGDSEDGSSTAYYSKPSDLDDQDCLVVVQRSRLQLVKDLWRRRSGNQVSSREGSTSKLSMPNPASDHRMREGAVFTWCNPVGRTKAGNRGMPFEIVKNLARALIMRRRWHGTKKALAEKIGCAESQIGRLLNPEYPKGTHNRDHSTELSEQLERNAMARHGGGRHGKTIEGQVLDSTPTDDLRPDQVAGLKDVPEPWNSMDKATLLQKFREMEPKVGHDWAEGLDLDRLRQAVWLIAEAKTEKDGGNSRRRHKDS